MKTFLMMCQARKSKGDAKDKKVRRILMLCFYAAYIGMVKVRGTSLGFV